MDYKKKLKKFKSEKDFFIGIDSDGCAFPTMELKHKECFIPNIIKYWGLQRISKYVRETAEWVNLYSIYRGSNRFPALVKVIELLSERDEIKKINFQLPNLTDLKKFIESGYSLSNSGLKEYIKTHQSPILERALEWSAAINSSVREMVQGVAPFPYVKESLEKLYNYADIMVVSATPVKVLEKEWNEHNIAQYVKLIGGQEMGNKKLLLEITAEGKYKSDHILMIGDAPGDHKAAQAISALFYPIKPGYEEESWERFYKEAIDKFLNEKYKGKYEETIIEEFYKLLPDTPPWKK